MEEQLSLEEEEQNNNEQVGEGREGSSSTAALEMTGTSQNQQPTTSSSNSPKPTKRPSPQHALAIVHDLSVALDEFKLTESELTLGKRKPNWLVLIDIFTLLNFSHRNNKEYNTIFLDFRIKFFN